MKTVRKQVGSIVGVVLALGVSVLAACSSKVPKEEGSDRFTVEAETVVADLEWGMTKAEVESVLATKENYALVPEIDAFVCYSVVDYQGIAGASGFLVLTFSDAGLLTEGIYYFDVTKGEKVPATSKGVMEDLNKAFRKTYQDSSEAMCEDPIGAEVWSQSLYYKGEESLVHIYGWMPTKLCISFMDVDAPFSVGLMQELNLD